MFEIKFGGCVWWFCPPGLVQHFFCSDPKKKVDDGRTVGRSSSNIIIDEGPVRCSASGGRGGVGPQAVIRSGCAGACCVGVFGLSVQRKNV